MSFGNGPAKGNGKQRIVGKSIADHMRDAIAQGKSVFEATAYVRAQCSCARCPKKRMHELYASLLPNDVGTSPLLAVSGSGDK